MTLENGIPITTEVLGFLEKNTFFVGMYFRISLEDGRILSISSTHVMFIQRKNKFIKDVFAKDIYIGDMVYAVYNRNVELVRVMNITKTQMSGAYVPLTDTGTLIVDDVLVSCYTNTDHWLAHSVLAPFRWYPSLLFGNGLDEKYKWTKTVTDALKKFGRYFNLATTQESMTEENNKRKENKGLVCNGLKDSYSH